MPLGTKKIAKATSSLLSLKRNKPCLDLGKVIEQVAQVTPFVLQTSPLETVDFYDRSDVKVGRVLESGQFFEWYKIKRLPDQEASDNGSAKSILSDSSRNSSANSTAKSILSDSSRNNAMTSSAQKQQHRAQYTVKQLHPKNFTKARKQLAAQAALRLVMEARYLSRLCHPHIVSAKGLPFGEGVVLQQGTPDCFYIVAPRMVESLEGRLSRWRQCQGDSKTEVETFDSDSVTFQRKLLYAKDLAGALAYLHKKKLVLLNLSPQSVGFLESGTLQITDLSCCQELEPGRERALMDEAELARLENRATTDMTTNYLLQIAANGGVPRYIAPEAILYDLYTTKADTYSWSLVVFELLTLTQPYGAYKNGPQHLRKVCVEGQRPNLSIHRLPKELQALLCKTWCQTVSRRLSMSKVLAAIPSPQIPEAKTIANPQA